MEFQTLKGSRNKKIIIGVIVFITIISMIFIGRSYASYRTTQSINIANGKINYKVPDLRVVAVKLQSSSGSTEYTDSNTIPASGYILNENKSVCGQPDGNGGATKDNTITLDYRSGRLYADNLKKNTRCYLYFDIQNLVTPRDIIDSHKIGTRALAEVLTDETTGMLYVGYDNDGPSYVYAGKVSDNWVKFGKENNQDIWWRIIRFNGDGSTRLIYSGTNAPIYDPTNSIDERYVMTGSKTQITINGNNTFPFNDICNSAEYVGYYYTSGEEHGNSTPSYVATLLNNWYNDNLKNNYEIYIKQDASFCSNRNTIKNYMSNYIGNGTGTTKAIFVPLTRIITKDDTWRVNYISSLICDNPADVFNTKVGLITSDEALMAGIYGINHLHYLYTGQSYYTMSPEAFDGSCSSNLYIDIDGNIFHYGYSAWERGIRPVINLETNVTFSGTGTYNDPYIVVGTSD